jgi:1,4-alpha-glucan branching enzyme
MKLGSFAFVLHTHMPYVRKAGRWPHGEEMLHEVMAESYVPLLNALYELKSEGIEPRLTLSLTPILLEQLADPDVKDNFELYLEERLALAEAEIAAHDKRMESHLSYLARWYRDWYANILASFRDRYHRDLVGAFKALSDAENLDLLTSAATHGYLPLFERDSTVYAQLKTGLETCRARFGRAPRGVWSPECGYRPAFMADRHYKPGLEEFFTDLNLSYFVVDTHMLTGDPLQSPRTSIGLAPVTATGAAPLRKFVVRADDRPEAKRRTTMRPYFLRASHVAVFGRDERTGAQVWSAAQGYPGDYVYREFHRRDPNSGLQYWRITAANTDLSQKEYYDPYPAFHQVGMHADHFVDTVCQLVRAYYYQAQATGIVISAYDTELFGHWWFEGVVWLKQVLRRMARSEDVELSTAGAYLEANPPTQVVSLHESSWGAYGDHSTWQNPETEWMWPLIHSAERTMEGLVAAATVPNPEMVPVLNQAARELLLLQSSDWPFLISTGQAKEYATSRFHQHLARFSRLVSIVHRGVLDPADSRFLESVADLDNPFPNIDYEAFAARDG